MTEKLTLISLDSSSAIGSFAISHRTGSLIQAQDGRTLRAANRANIGKTSVVGFELAVGVTGAIDMAAPTQDGGWAY